MFNLDSFDYHRQGAQENRGEPNVSKASRIWIPWLSPILALTIAGLLALGRPAAAEIWGADCWPLRVEYNFNTGFAAIFFLAQTSPMHVATGRITNRGSNPDGSLFAHASFPGSNNLVIVNINTRQLFVDYGGQGSQVCVANTYVAP